MFKIKLFQVSKGKNESAIKSIQWLRGNDYNYTAELEELKETDAHIKQNPVSIGSALTRRVTIKALIISLGLMFFQQLSGINAVIFYTTSIFRVSLNHFNELIKASSKNQFFFITGCSNWNR